MPVGNKQIWNIQYQLFHVRRRWHASGIFVPTLVLFGSISAQDFDVKPDVVAQLFFYFGSIQQIVAKPKP